MIGIYKITSPSGKVYIGQSLNIDRRFRQYKLLYNSCKAQRRLWNSLIKYSPTNHIFEVLYNYDYTPIQKDLDSKEKEYWQLYKEYGIELLNLREPGRKGVWNNESKERLSKSIKGRKQTPEHIAHRSGIYNGMYGKKGELSPFYGKHHSDEINQANRVRMLGKQCSLGLKRSVENIKKLSGGNNHSARKVINNDTGKIYSCIKDAAIDLNILYSTAKLLVRNKLKQRKINLIYYENRSSINSDK